jgi:hypothetical protein
VLQRTQNLTVCIFVVDDAVHSAVRTRVGVLMSVRVIQAICNRRNLGIIAAVS